MKKKTILTFFTMIMLVLLCTAFAGAETKSTVKTEVTVSLSKQEVECRKKQNIPSVKVTTKNGKVLKNGRDYTVKVSSDTSVCGKYKLTVILTGKYSGKYKVTFKVIPARVKALCVTECKSQSAKLKWDKVKCADSYELYRWSNEAGKWVKFATVTKNSYTVKGLTPLKRSLFAVIACATDKNGKKYSSDMRKIAIYTKPQTVKNLKATAGLEKAKLSWNTVSRADGYVIAYSASKDFKDGTIKYKTVNGKDKSTKYLLNLTGGKKLYVRIRAYGYVREKKLFSDASEVITLTPYSVPNGSPVTSATQCAVVYDVRNQKTIYSKNPDKKMLPASMTKLATACTALEYASPEKIYNIGSEIRLTDPLYSICGLHEGYKMTLYDMLCGMLMPSGCDAAISIAAHVGKDVGGDMSNSEAVDYFCKLMNRFAKKIGMNNSHFNSPEGYERWSHYTTAADMVKLVDYALNNRVVASIVKCNTKTRTIASGETLHFQSTNRMLNPDSQYYNKNVIGMKTGTTTQAGYCISIAYDNGMERFIIVSMGNETNYDRYNSVQRIIDKYTF